MFEAFSSIFEVAMFVTPRTRKIVLLRTMSGKYTELWLNNSFQNMFEGGDVFARTVQYIAAHAEELKGFKTKIEHNRLEIVFP